MCVGKQLVDDFNMIVIKFLQQFLMLAGRTHTGHQLLQLVGGFAHS